MKHIFVVNPKAGKINRVEDIKNQLKAYDGRIDYEIYPTKAIGDGISFVREYLNSHSDKEIYRFYACGGDGTLNEVVAGANGHSNVEVAVYACGSGNDFIKNFGNGPEFRSIDALINGEGKKIDLIKVDNKVCVNIVSFGFDGEVTFAMHKFKRWPLVTGRMAYNLAAVTSLLFKMSASFKLEVDDEVVFDGRGLLAAVANGHTYGGGFRCAPEACVDDGIMDICLCKKISRFKASSLMSLYKKGEHLTNPKFKDVIIYKKGKRVKITSTKPVAYQIDGETFRKNSLAIEIEPLAISFVIPKK